MARGGWLLEGVDPLPPPLSDKMTDREALRLAGGVEARIVGKRVLDLGPCYGQDAIDFGTLARPYVALDYDELVIEWVRKVAPAARGVVSDALALPFADATFDTVIDFGSADNIDPPEEVYRELCRVLRPGGMLITTYGNALLLGRSPFPREYYSVPDELVALLDSYGCTTRQRSHEEHARAILVAEKR